jgi:chemotaxis protein methyltransferase CheR
VVELEQLDEKQCGRFCDLIYVSSGIRVDDRKIILLSNRIRRRLKAGGFKNFEEYYQFLTSRAGAAELEHFLDAITTNETFFFRTKHHFEWFKSVFIPDAIAEFRRGERDSILTP